jgi:penicillin-binding protein 1A
MTMRDGLVFSKNTITAQVMQDVGVAPIVKLAQDMGVRQSKLAAVPSIALGTSPVTLLEMVSAYSTIAAQGEYRKPVFVRKITDRDGNVVADFASQTPQRVLSQASAVTLIDMMRGVINRGTGTGVRYRFGINADVAGKTGTTQNNADGWFIMMHPNLVAGAWVGFNDNRVTMRSNYWGQGGHSAILLVGDFFKTALDAASSAPMRSSRASASRSRCAARSRRKTWKRAATCSRKAARRPTAAAAGDEPRSRRSSRMREPPPTPERSRWTVGCPLPNDAFPNDRGGHPVPTRTSIKKSASRPSPQSAPPTHNWPRPTPASHTPAPARPAGRPLHRRLLAEALPPPPAAWSTESAASRSAPAPPSSRGCPFPPAAGPARP